MNKKILATALAAAMLASLAASCGGSGSTSSTSSKPASSGTTSTSSTAPSQVEGDTGLGFKMDPAGYPVMDEPVTVTACGFSTMPEGVGAWDTPNEIPYFKNQEERTNIHIEWNNMTSTALEEKLPIMFAGDDLPDIFFKTYMDAATMGKYGADGMLVDLTELIPQYAPDLYALLSARDQMKFMTYNGGIWGFPYYFESEGIRMSKLFVNQTFLDNLGMEAPTNWEELHDYMKAVTEQDANGDGDPTNEVACCLSSVGHITNVVAAGKYGLMNRGSSMGGRYIEADPADASGNTLRTWIDTDEMKEVYRDIKGWWDEGLLSPSLFDTDYWDNVARAALKDGRGGMFGSYVTAAGTHTEDFVAMPKAPGDTWNYVSGYLSGLGSGMITKECEIPEAMTAWFNYAYTMTGAYEYFLGIEGESYTIDSDGHVQLSEIITNHPELEQEQAHLRYSYYSGGGNPGLATDETFKGGETHIISLRGCDNFRPATEKLTIWENFPLTAEQSEVINGTKGDIDAVYAEYRAAFITGTKDIDADWDEYLERLETAGLSEFLATYQEAYDMINS